MSDPNGAGKTSLFNLIAGGVSPAAGTIRLDGKDITRARPHQRCIAGIGRSYQIPQPFENADGVRKSSGRRGLWARPERT